MRSKVNLILRNKAVNEETRERTESSGPPKGGRASERAARVESEGEKDERRREKEEEEGKREEAKRDEKGTR